MNLKFPLLSLALTLATLCAPIRAAINWQPSTTNPVTTGAKGKVTVFSDYPGFYDLHLSINNRYLLMRGGDAEDGATIVYDIETGLYAEFENEFLVEFIDDNNFASGQRVVYQGVTYDAWIGLRSYYMSSGAGVWEVAGTDSSMRYVRVNTYDLGDKTYITVVIDILGNNGEGEVLYQLPHYEPNTMHYGYGSWAMNTSNDMSVMAGFTSYPSVAFSNISPAFWDCSGSQPQIFYTGGHTEEEAEGQLYACTNNGDIIVGGNSIIYYNRANKTFTREECDGGFMGMSISETGMIAGMGLDENSLSIEASTAALYDIRTQKTYMVEDFVHELYGIDPYENIIDLNRLVAISDNGRILAGWSFADGMLIPYLFEFDENQLHAAPRRLTAKQIGTTEQVRLTWNKPVTQDYTVAGYHVYRNGTRVTATPVTETAMTDYGVKSGTHFYQVEAVYTDGATTISDSLQIITVSDMECLPVQDIVSTLTYNLTATLRWGRPAAMPGGFGMSALNVKNVPESINRERFEGVKNVVSAEGSVAQKRTAPLVAAPAEDQAEGSSETFSEKGQDPKYTAAENTLDLIDMRNTGSLYTSACVRVGDYYYVANYQAGFFYVYDAVTWTYLQTVSVERLRSVYDLAVHENYIYAVSRDKYVYVIIVNEDDPFDLSLSYFFTCKFAEAVNISHVEGETGNEDDDYLLVGDWNNLAAYRVWAVNADDTLPCPEINLRHKYYNEFSGSEVHNNILYLANQNGTNGASIEAYDLTTGNFLSETDLYEYPQLLAASLNSYGYSGALTLNTLEDGTVALAALVQPYNAYNQLLWIEIETLPGVIGYNLYRNGQKVNTDYIKCRHYSEDLEPGEYEYVVEYVSELCSSRSDDPNVNVTETVTVAERGRCLPPVDVAVREAVDMAYLSWSLEETGTQAGLVGFNLYCNNELISEHLRDFKYLDAEAEKGGHYVYRVEAFYDNACRAADSVEITLEYAGSPMPPTLVKAEAVKGSDGQWKADLSWDLPYYEEVLSYGYCNQPYSYTAFDGFNSTFAFAGWNKNNMPDFFEDLYLVGFEFVLATDQCDEVNAIVYVDDKMVYNKPLNTRLKVEAWTQEYFSEIFPMKQENEIAVGYGLKYDPDVVTNGTLVYDMGPGHRGYSDICSPNLNDFYYLADNGIDANLCINALVVRRMDLDAVLDEDGKPDATKLAAKALSLKGFNVYRDGEKLNPALLTDFRFEDAGVKAKEEYEYEIGAVYELTAGGSEETLSEPVYLEIIEISNEGLEAGALRLKMYPNPVGNGTLTIEGVEMNRLEIYTLDGKLVEERHFNGTAIKRTSLNAAELPEGMYIIKTVGPRGTGIGKFVKK